MPIANINGMNILFIHVPKTGGSSVEYYLGQNGTLTLIGNKKKFFFRCSEQHLHAEPLRKYCNPADMDWIFMIVRHPVDRIISEYRFQMRKQKFIRNALSFSNWLRYSLTVSKINGYHRDNHFRPQHSFEIKGAEIFRFEDGISNCISKISERLNIPCPSIEIHKKRSQNMKVKISKQDLKLIEHYYKKDFDLYSYSSDFESVLYN